MEKLKNTISLFAILFISFIFSYKYTSRYTEFGFAISSIILVSQLAVYKYGNKLKISKKYFNIIGYLGILPVIALAFISYLKIPIESLNVDRWSVITGFWTEAFNGNYPYFAKSHMGNPPGPMPFYFIIALPFYLIGELSFLGATGYIIMIFLIIKNRKNNKNFLLFFLATSMFIIWEITTRSNLFTFTTLVLLVLNEMTNLKEKSGFAFYLLAILTGFALSTRGVYILVYIIFYLSNLINKETEFKKLVIFTIVSAGAFISTFIPLLAIYGDDFFVMNPFIVQSTFLIPQSYTIGFIIIAIILSFLVKNKVDKFFYGGLSLFFAILVYAIHHLLIYGYETAFINSKIDISYFIFSVPFFMIYLSFNKPDLDEDKNQVYSQL